MKKVIVITGTPGSGKTRIANILEKKIKNTYLISVNEIISSRRLFSSYAKDGAMIVKLRSLQKEIEEVISIAKGTIIIEGHLLCEMKIKGATVIIMREHLQKLKSRLMERNYDIGKIRDNLVSEATDYCGERARKNYDKVFEVMDDRMALKEILNIINGKGKGVEQIDLLEELTPIIKNDKRFAIGG